MSRSKPPELDLKPCPFCGSEAEAVSMGGYDIIRCGNPDCMVDACASSLGKGNRPHCSIGTWEQMAAHWNKRFGED